MFVKFTCVNVYEVHLCKCLYRSCDLGLNLPYRSNVSCCYRLLYFSSFQLVNLCLPYQISCVRLGFTSEYFVLYRLVYTMNVTNTCEIVRGDRLVYPRISIIVCAWLLVYFKVVLSRSSSGIRRSPEDWTRQVELQVLECKYFWSVSSENKSIPYTLLELETSSFVWRAFDQLSN